MIVKKVAHRYAQALFLEAKSRGILDKVAQDMQRIGETVAGSRELLLFLRSKVVSRQAKTAVLGELFGKDRAGLTTQFIRLVLDKRREDQLPGISHVFGKHYRKEQGLIDVEILVAQRPGTDQTDLLRKSLELKTGKKVLLNFKEDPGLQGGMAVRIGDTIIDGTIKHKLQQLEATFHKTGM